MDVVAGVLLAGGEDGAGPGVHVGYGGGQTGCEACSGAGPSVGCDVMQDPSYASSPGAA